MFIETVFSPLIDEALIGPRHFDFKPALQEYCQGQLKEEPQYKVSRHLGILRRVGLLNETKDGRWVHYSIQSSEDPFFSHLYQAIGSISHETLQADEQRLRERLTLREDGKCLLGVQKKHLLSGKGK